MNSLPAHRTLEISANTLIVLGLTFALSWLRARARPIAWDIVRH